MKKKETYKIEDGLIIEFDQTNSNCLLFKKDGKLINAIALPPIMYGCDIISLNDKINDGYTFNFSGLILITDPFKRQLYYKGTLMTEIKR